MVETTDDGRYIVVDGRRWRATNPAIPAPLATEVVRELMAARRAVGAAGNDEEAVGQARDRVHDAKIALGERGEPWWGAPSQEGAKRRIGAAIRALLRAREPNSSICPSEAARIASGSDWRSQMDTVRAVASDLARADVVVITQRERPVDDLDAIAGPIRLSRGPALR